MRLRIVAALSVTVLLAVVSPRQGFGQVASPEGAASVTVTVDATHPWVDSGLTVRKGKRLSFKAAGTILWGAKPDQMAGPEGHGGHLSGTPKLQAPVAHLDRT